MLRGINRQTIFKDDEDCEKYLHCLKDCKAKSGFILYAYCLMGNHIHLLIREVKEPLNQIFKRIGARYVFWYNWKYKRSGHLFQDRYKSEPIMDDKQFIAVLRYIYQNPIKAKMCNKLEDYRWSSYRFLGEVDSLIDNSKITEFTSIDQLRTIVKKTTEDQFVDLEPDRRITDREAEELTKAICGIEYANGFDNMKPEKQAEDIIKLHNAGCSIRQLVRITGVTKSKVERILR